jgi:hypothetical protein
MKPYLDLFQILSIIIIFIFYAVRYKPDMVRIGKPEKMRDRVETFLSMDAHVDQKRNMSEAQISAAIRQVEASRQQCLSYLQDLEEYAIEHFVELFGNPNVANARRDGFQRDLMREHEALHKHTVELQRLQIAAVCERTFLTHRGRRNFTRSQFSIACLVDLNNRDKHFVKFRTFIVFNCVPRTFE